MFVPPCSDLYILLYVHHHDVAYRWAEHRKLSINPVTGAMQVVLLEEVRAPGEPAATATRPLTRDTIERQPLFDRLSDTDLLSLGTPTDPLAQGVATLDAYRAARRVGRGVVLSRARTTCASLGMDTSASTPAIRRRWVTAVSTSVVGPASCISTTARPTRSAVKLWPCWKA
ncbi:MAG: hypothetical protein HYZ81_05545 [Nitrospinae bacterium]|nr:hypothetical protein [Nitrospinota bacterium]